MARGHAEALIPMIEIVLGDVGLPLRRIDALAVTVGPGTFTGIRIGLAAAQGIGLAAGVPVCGVTTFAAVAEAIPESARQDRRLFALLDSKRGDLFVQEYNDHLTPAAPSAALCPERVAGLLSEAPAVAAGDGAALLRPLIQDRLSDGTIHIHSEGPADARSVASVAVRLFSSGQISPPVPLYLRAPDVRIESNAGSTHRNRAR